MFSAIYTNGKFILKRYQRHTTQYHITIPDRIRDLFSRNYTRGQWQSTHVHSDASRTLKHFRKFSKNIASDQIPDVISTTPSNPHHDPTGSVIYFHVGSLRLDLWKRTKYARRLEECFNTLESHEIIVKYLIPDILSATLPIRNQTWFNSDQNPLSQFFIYGPNGSPKYVKIKKDKYDRKIGVSEYCIERDTWPSFYNSIQSNYQTRWSV